MIQATETNDGTNDDTNIELKVIREFRRIHAIDEQIVGNIDDIISLLDTVFVGAELPDGDLIGYAAYDMQDPHETHLQRVFVAKEYRGIGVGKALATARCAKRGPLFAMIPEQSVDDQCFLRACGYVAVEIHQHDDGSSLFLMEHDSE